MDIIEMSPECENEIGQMLQLVGILKRLTDILEQMIQHPAAVNHTTYNYYAPHLENHGPVTYNAPIYNSSQTPTGKKPKVTNEHIARALMALNGKNNVIDSQRAWLGACCLLGAKYGFPRNLGDCCKKIDALPMNMNELEFQCKYESIRMYGSWKFVKEKIEDWPSYTPREDERQIFEKSLSVVQSLDKEIEKQMELDV